MKTKVCLHCSFCCFCLLKLLLSLKCLNSSIFLGFFLLVFGRGKSPSSEATTNKFKYLCVINEENQKTKNKNMKSYFPSRLPEREALKKSYSNIFMISFRISLWSLNFSIENVNGYKRCQKQKVCVCGGRVRGGRKVRVISPSTPIHSHVRMCALGKSKVRLFRYEFYLFNYQFSFHIHFCVCV